MYSLVLHLILVALIGLLQSLPTYLLICFFFFSSQEELDLIDREDEQKFLTSADYLATNSMPSLISHVKSAVKEVLKGYISLSLVFLLSANVDSLVSANANKVS